MFRSVWVPRQRAVEARCPYLRSTTSRKFLVQKREDAKGSTEAIANPALCVEGPSCCCGVGDKDQIIINNQRSL